MHIIVVGVDHTRASIELREHLACPNRQIPLILQMTRLRTQGCVLLSTCNRVELYAVCPDVSQGCADLLHVLSETRQIAYDELKAHCHSFIDEQAISHLFGVACGLYSQVPGEPQIQGQVATALEIAQDGGYAGPLLSALFRAALLTGKRARSETGISRNAVSISHVAVQLARHLLPNFQEASILLVGSGKMSELAARNLCNNGAQHLVIVNRTHTNAIELAQSLKATLRPFAELREALVDADVAISSTTAPHTIITTEMMQLVMEQRNGRPLLLIDIALPRDVDPAVGTLAGVHLANLDDLQTEIERGIHLRLQEVERVQAIVTEEVNEFERWLSSLSVVDTITNLRQHVDDLRQQELARTLRQLTSTLSERDIEAVQELTMRLMNKVLHTPMLRLKDAAAAGQGYVYAEATRYLFDLEEKSHAGYDRNASQQTGYDPNAVGSPATMSAVD
jgi:glutamyl-tRNA reductase